MEKIEWCMNQKNGIEVVEPMRISAKLTSKKQKTP